jgi:hypothetical protein
MHTTESLALFLRDDLRVALGAVTADLAALSGRRARLSNDNHGVALS